MSSTVSKLSEMTDEAKFEQLATAVLRIAQPEYGALLHPGINPAGKTVKAPVDGIGFVLGAKPSHMIAAHHTTCKRDDLRKKWLHNPANVKGSKSRRPTMPAGDLVKTAKIIETERKREPTLHATLILTTNQEPAEELVRDTQAAGRTHGFEVDIWSASRLAGILDNSPSGQWLRYVYFGVEQEQLSHELLGKLSRASLDIHRPVDDATAWVARSLDRAISDKIQEQDIVFIVAESGLGKSVACYKRLDQHLAKGGFGLVLPDQVLSSVLTIEQAVTTALHQLHPRLTTKVGPDALSLCSADHPLVLVVEDINKSGQGSLLAEKLAKWSSAGNPSGKSDDAAGTPERRRWRLLCPIWPGLIASLSDTARKQIQSLSLEGAPLTMQEGREAIQRRAKLKGVYLSELDADAISDALGHDPLLIALHEQGDRLKPELVIEQFIEASISRLATKRGEYTAGDYRVALRSTACTMLSHRELSPSWEILQDWLAGDSGAVVMLRHLVHHGEVVRLSGGPSKGKMSFRHDRVRDALFTEAIATLIRSGTVSDDLFAEPYFAEVIGVALLQDDILPVVVDRVRATNPLALFHALRQFREPTNDIHHAILVAIDMWLAEPETHKRQHLHLRREALAVLSRTESSKVVALVPKFNDDSLWTAWQARFINGDVTGGLQLCLHVEPGSGAVWRDRQIEHAKTHFGSRFRTTISQLLGKADLDSASRVGALRFAGYLADSQLAESIERSWNNDADKAAHLKDYLWALAQCCGSDPDRFLGPVCDSWAALPAERADNMPSPRDDLAAHHVRWAFHKQIPFSAIHYFIKRAKTEDLRWQITYMLHELDHPDAVEFVVRELAETDRQLEGTERFSPFAVSAKYDWQRRQEDLGRPMSRESKQRLLGLWQNQANDKHVRKQAFRIWAATEAEDDLTILRSVDESDPLAESALWERLQRKDRTAVPGLILKLKGDRKRRSLWWHLAHAVWCDELEELLEEELSARSVSSPDMWGKATETDYQVSRLIMTLPPSKGESTLLKHWEHLQFCDLFVQAALYFATPALLRHVEQAVKSCPDPKAIFKHIDTHYGIRTKGRTGITHRKQVEILSPYLCYLDELAIHTFWEECNQLGWYDLRRKILDPLVSRQYNGVYIDKTHIISSLNNLVIDKRIHWIDFSIEQYLKCGFSPPQIITVIGNWLADKKDFAALQLAAEAVIHIGRRQDLQILETGVDPRDAAAALRIDATFAVKRRSLR